MTVVFYISSHGFGHATRDFEVIRQMLNSRPGTRILVRSSVDERFLSREAPQSVVLERCETDTGIAQIDSLELDEAATARRAADFYRDFAGRVETEARILRDRGADLVVGDVPPLAFAAASRVGIPSIALANFTWDWIYDAYPQFARLAPGVVDLIRAAYATASIALRLPFAGGFEPMRSVTRDVPLIARRSLHGREHARAVLGLDGTRPIVLASFGGYGAALPFFEVAGQNDFTLVVTDHEAAVPTDSLVRCFTSGTLARNGLRYEDLVAAADVVVSKPGYGIVSECIANSTALLYTSRGFFVEHDVLVAGMQPFLRCRYITQDDLRAGRWQAAIDALLNQPPPAHRIDVAGAATVAGIILEAGSG